MQRAAVELLLLSIPAGVLGSWIVLRRLAFFAHAVGPATFPALTVAQAASINPQASALVFAVLFAGIFDRTARRGHTDRDAAAGLILVGSLALGALLASDVFKSSSQVDSLLFGSVLATGSTELALTLAVVLLTILSFAIFGRVWLAAGFDSDYARSLGLKVALADLALLVMAAIAIGTSVFAVGALLVSALFVIPAATVRLVTRSLKLLIICSVLLAAIQGVFSIWLAYRLDLPPGTSLALTAGASFFTVIAYLEIRSLFYGGSAFVSQSETAK